MTTDDLRRADPRAARTRAKVLAAAAKVLAAEGSGAVTHQRVAAEAGVGRATMYRHWPTSADLLYEAMVDADTPLFHPGPGTLFTWLRAELLRIGEEMTTTTSMQFTAALISRVPVDPEVRSLRDRILERARAPLSDAVRRAVIDGELTGSPPQGYLLAMLVGPLLFLAMSEGGRPDGDFVDAVIDSVFGSYRQRVGAAGVRSAAVSPAGPCP